MIALADVLAGMAPAGVRLIGAPVASQFEGFAYDSRKLVPGELFLAVRTARADGHDFVADAIRRGAAGVLGDRLNPDAALGVTTLAVDDTLGALRAWACFVLTTYAPTVIAVVGSLGKSVAAKATVAALGGGDGGDPTIFDGDYHNTLYGLPIGLGKLQRDHRIAVLELRGEGAGELCALAELAQPAVLVVTRGFDETGAQEELARVIERLPSTARLVLNADDPCLRGLAERCHGSVRTYGWLESADVRAEAVEYQVSATAFRVVAAGESATAELTLVGEPAVSGGLAAVAAGLALGQSLPALVAGLARLAPLAGRLAPRAGRGGCSIYDDSYHAGRDSLDVALASLRRSPGRRFVVLGALATDDAAGSDELQRQAGEAVAARIDHLVTLGAAAEATALAALASGMPRAAVTLTESADDAARALDGQLSPGDVVLVIGGAEARLERVVARLLAEPERADEFLVRQDSGWKQRVFLSKERPTWVEIDHRAIGENVSRLKEIARPAALMAVLKADAYGHGAVRVARTALIRGADYLATACLSEAISLRAHGIAAPILILGFTPPWQAPEVVHYELTATVYSLEIVHHLSREALARGRTARVQVKVDTGMGRLGLLPNEVPSFVAAIRALAGIDLEGIYTHFACADAPDPLPTLAQLARFNAVLTTLDENGWQPRYVHAANSAATLRFPEARYTMVRSGIAMYGQNPSDHVRCPTGFRPALTFKTLVAQVKDLPAGSPISYGATFVTSRASRIAVLPVGYGDGFRRSPANWGEVLVRGRRAPIVGVVCMDMTMVDVTDVPGVRTGDEVVLIGRQGEDEISVADVARRLGTIPYEVITQILARVPREVAPGV